MLERLDYENADRDLTSTVTVLTHTPDANHDVMSMGLILLGDGAKDLDGSGGVFELTITVGGQTVEPSPQLYNCGAHARMAFWTSPFPVPAGLEVIMRVKSPNAADSDVDTRAYLFDCGDTELHLAKAALVNKRLHTVATGVDVIKDDNGSDTLKTLTPSEASGVVTVTPS